MWIEKDELWNLNDTEYMNYFGYSVYLLDIDAEELVE